MMSNKMPMPSLMEKVDQLESKIDDRLGRIEVKLDLFKEISNDRENRIRVLERWMNRSMGMAVIAGAVVSAWVSFVYNSIMQLIIGK